MIEMVVAVTERRNEEYAIFRVLMKKAADVTADKEQTIPFPLFTHHNNLLQEELVCLLHCMLVSYFGRVMQFPVAVVVSSSC